MRVTFRFTLYLLALILPGPMGVASADDRVVVKPHAAKKFATMPADAPFPEGITANPNNGEIIVGTFGGTINLVRFSTGGEVLAEVTIPGGPFLGLAFNPADGMVYICSADDLAGAPPSRIRRIDADFTDASSVEDVAAVPIVGAPADRVVGNPDFSSDTIVFGNNARAPNDLTFDYDGNLYYSDSFQGAIFRINDTANCGGAGPACMTDTIAHHPLLATAGFPPFGANGVALSLDEQTLFVNNTGDDRVLSIDLTGGFPATPVVFAESINGADGIVSDKDGRLWIAANQADQIVVLDGTTGRVIAQFGAFLGIQKNGSPQGLLFPASLVIVNDKKVIVTNLALPLGTSADEPEAAVIRYTVSRINIPKHFDD